MVKASDFALEISNLPPHKNIKELKAYLWCWVEYIQENESQNAIHPKTGTIDENQNRVMNINFGLNDYERMKYLLKMAG